MQKFKYVVRVYKYEDFYGEFSGMKKTMYNYMCNCGFSSYVIDNVDRNLEQAKHHHAIHNTGLNKMGHSAVPIYVEKHIAINELVIE